MNPEAPGLIPLAQASRVAAEFEARPDARGAWAAFLACTALSVAGWVAPFLSAAPVWGQALLAIWMGGWFALMARIAWIFVAGARDEGGWAVRAGPEGLFINLRSHLNYRRSPDDAVVLRLPRSQVRRLTFESGELREPFYDDGVCRGRRAVRQTLVVEPWGHLAGVSEALGEEGRRWTPAGLGKSRVRHFPVALREGRLRIAWRDPARRLRPDAAEAQAALARWFPVGQALIRDLAEIGALPRPDQERRIADLARSGQTVTAIALARELFGLTLTEAKALVDRIA